MAVALVQPAPKRIVLIVGHPDPEGAHFGHALAEAYAAGARAGGHDVSVVRVAQIDFPVLRTKADFDHHPVPASLQAAQGAIGRAEHLVFVYPLWFGSMPALLKAFVEQVFRPGFAFETLGGTPKKLLKGKSARLVVTMGMPAWLYRWFYRAHGVKTMQGTILQGCGIDPVRTSLVGNVEASGPSARARWLVKMNALGHQGI